MIGTPDPGVAATISSQSTSGTHRGVVHKYFRTASCDALWTGSAFFEPLQEDKFAGDHANSRNIDGYPAGYVLCTSLPVGLRAEASRRTPV